MTITTLALFSNWVAWITRDGTGNIPLGKGEK